MTDHRQDLRKGKESNALHIHRRDFPGHSHDLKGATLVYASNQTAKRQLVESSLIATTANCNLRPGDFPVCRLMAPVILRSLKLETPPSQQPANPIPDATPAAPVVATAPAPAPPSGSPISILPQAHTSPEDLPIICSAPTDTPDIPQLQSQARALPTTFSSLLSSHSSSPIGRRTRSRMRRRLQHPLPSPSAHIHSQLAEPSPRHRPHTAPLTMSPVLSPTASTGAIRKRRRPAIESPDDITGNLPKRHRNPHSAPCSQIFSPIITRFLRRHRLASSPSRYHSQVK